MQPDRDPPPRRALVLAGGGVVGGLYEVGALIALDAVWDGFTACDFDLYVGSSAGAFVAALLANRVSPEMLREVLESDQKTLPRLAGSRLLTVPWRAHLTAGPRLAAALPGLLGDLYLHWREVLVVETLAALFRHLPHGVFTLDGLERYVRGVLSRGGRTNEFGRLRRRLLVPATELDTGAIHVFGAGRSEPTPISSAVAASAAVPILFEPVRIHGVDYIDASITKTAHAGLAVERGASLVVIVHPIHWLTVDQATPRRIRDGGALGIAGQALRIALRRRLHDGIVRHAYESPGTDLLLLEPYEHDLELFDTPLMTYSRHREVVRRGYRTTIKTILADFDRNAALFAHHGIAVRPRGEIERRARRWSSAWQGARAAVG